MSSPASTQAQTAVVSGATGVLGSALASDLASRGFNLALLGRDQTALDALAAGFAAPAHRVLAYAVDLLDPDAAHRAADAVAGRFGRVDVLLHVVGGWIGGKTVLEMPADDLVAMLNQHVWTSFNAVRAFVPHMLRGGYGRIVMISSTAGARPSARGGAYAIGKAGQEALMLTLSQELKGTGVTANVLQVRMIDAERKKVSAPAAENASWTTPEEIAAAIRYLLSDEAAIVNGAKLPLFGSYS